MTIKYFIYARKSTESEDKQMASIEDQIAEMNRLAQDFNLQVIDTISEAKSAKEPGRAGFNQMLKRIQRGQAQGILCWKLNRLARNPIDGGQISWLLQQNIIKHIQTFGSAYKPSDNVLMMQVEFGMANQYIKDLSVDVKRGIRRKAERGWYACQHLPIGYIHNTGYKLGIDDEILPDPKKFHLVKSLWRKMLTGLYSVADIKREGDKIGLCNSGKQPLSHNGYHKLFTNEFYCGIFNAKDEHEELKQYEGKHKKMVSVEQFQKVQKILRSKGSPTRLATYTFPYRGLISCGNCGGFVTAEHKLQAICTNCKFKFSIKTNTVCPKCNIDLSNMPAKPTLIDKTYYHCTKNHGPCEGGCITNIEVESKIIEALKTISINQEFYNWALGGLEYLEKQNDKNSTRVTQLKKRKSELEQRMHGYLKMRADNEISSDEFRLMREKTESEVLGINNELAFEKEYTVNWKKAAEQHLLFSLHALNKFRNAEETKKKSIVSELASNLELKDKKLEYSIPKSYQVVKECEVAYEAKKKCFEPKITIEKYSRNSHFTVPFFLLRKQLTSVRTCLLDKLRSDINSQP